MTNSIEMGHNFEELIKKLEKRPYKEKFDFIYKDEITPFNLTDAISDETIFKRQGCISSHHGVNVFGMYIVCLNVSELLSTSEERHEVSKNKSDKYYFKVLILRNIELTASFT